MPSCSMVLLRNCVHYVALMKMQFIKRLLRYLLFEPLSFQVSLMMHGKVQYAEAESLQAEKLTNVKTCKFINSES